jgi:hypothetical protein
MGAVFHFSNLMGAVFHFNNLMGAVFRVNFLHRQVNSAIPPNSIAFPVAMVQQLTISKPRPLRTPLSPRINQPDNQTPALLALSSTFPTA